MKCTKHRTNGLPCGAQAVAGTDACTKHSGRPIAEQRAKGAVILELAQWGLNGETVRDPGQTLLQLMTQSALRVEFYSSLLGQAYEAAERLRAAVGEVPPGYTSMDGPTVDQVPGQQPNSTDLDRAQQDLDRIFTTGGVASLIGYKYGAAGKDGNLYVAEEAIRGLVQLEAAERDRCANMAVKAVAAGLAERQVKLAEREGALVVAMIRNTLTDLGLDPSSPQVMQVVSTRLRELVAA